MYLLEEGTHCRPYEKMGAHVGELAGQRGVNFAVWAPNAKQVIRGSSLEDARILWQR
jgi:1,4-alpha-glucan branching enzyme